MTDASWLQALLESRRPAPGPVVGRWALGIGVALDIRIPAEVRHPGLLGTRELAPGMFAAVVLADPAVRQCFEATAQAHGVELRPTDDDVMDDAEHRAEQIKSMLAKLKP
jgi:hypothetical protein